MTYDLQALHDLVLDEPVFVLGSPRSGTTLLRLMLACHPALAVAPECGFAVFLADRFGDWTAGDVPRFAAAVVASRKFDTWGLDEETLRDFLADRAPSTYAEACAWVYVRYGLSLGRPFHRWGDKNNFHVHHVAELAGLWPRASFVHIVRDGRDVACSYRELMARDLPGEYRPRLSSDIVEIALEWSGNVRAVRSALARLDVPSIEVHFEDLVRDPRAVLGRVVAAIGEEFSPEMLDYPRRGLEPSATMPWKERTSEAPRADRVGRWRVELTPAQVRAFEAVAAPELNDLGYPVEAA